MAENLFCAVCGTRTVNGVCPKCNPGMAQGGYGNADNDKYRKIFVDSNEQFVGALGNSYLQNFLLSGSISNGFSVISNRRVYFNGTTFYLNNGQFTKQTESKIVDLKDVTGSGTIAINPVKFLALGLLFMILGVILFFVAIGSAASGASGAGPGVMLLAGLPIGIVGIVFLVVYFKKKMTLLKIDFAGGCIAFNIKWYPPAECDAFQRSLRMAKDNAQREEENRSANAMRAAMSAVAMPQQAAPAASGADELMKYASMLEKGLITQEEFNAAKARLLK